MSAAPTFGSLRQTPVDQMMRGGPDRSAGPLRSRRRCTGHESVTDIIVLMGYYTTVSLTMNFYAGAGGKPRPGALRWAPGRYQ